MILYNIRMRWAEHVVRLEEGRYISADKTQQKRPLGRRKRRLERNIKMNLIRIINMCFRSNDLGQRSMVSVGSEKKLDYYT
jgi:hypothetical protein